MKAAYNRYAVRQLRYSTVLCVRFSGWCKENKWHVKQQIESEIKSINGNYFPQNGSCDVKCGRCFEVSCASGSSDSDLHPNTKLKYNYIVLKAAALSNTHTRCLSHEISTPQQS